MPPLVALALLNGFGTISCLAVAALSNDMEKAILAVSPNILSNAGVLLDDESHYKKLSSYRVNIVQRPSLALCSRYFVVVRTCGSC